MKLYTEEQVREAIEMAREGIRSKDSIIDSINFIKPPIELPTDDEIKQLNPYPFASSGSNLIWYFGAKDVVNWMRNKIQGGNK
jgi:hypothetical protein